MRRVRERDVGKYTDQVVTFVEGAAVSIGKGLFNTVLILVISIYMLLDMHRLRARSTGASHRDRESSRCCCESRARSRRTCAGSCCSA